MSHVESVSVVIPVFNEEESLEELHRRTRAVLVSLGLRFEFIFVNDGSSDRSHARLARLRDEFPEICIISHRRNHGKSMALMQGFARASGDAAIMMDADLQDEPENIPVMLEKLATGYDLVNGWRADRNDPFFKRLVSGVYNLITRRVLGLSLHDINCGFKVMRKDLYKCLSLRGDLHRLIPAMAQNLGFAVTEVPISHAPRKHGVSKYRLLRHRGLLDIISLTSTLAYRVRPFHIFLGLFRPFGGGPHRRADHLPRRLLALLCLAPFILRSAGQSHGGDDVPGGGAGPRQHAGALQQRGVALQPDQRGAQF